jgi:hypothetical protein
MAQIALNKDEIRGLEQSISEAKSEKLKPRVSVVAEIK